MILRKRILVAISTTFAILVLVLYLASRIILVNNFTELEEQFVRRDVERVRSALFDELAALDMTLSDWSAWDDTYEFIQDLDEKYIASNLVDETFIGSRLNLILYVDSSGQVVFGKAFDLDRGKEAPIPQSLYAHLTEDTLLNHPNPASGIAGIVLLPQDPLLVAARPILTSEEKGPIRGTMIMGRYLNQDEVERLAQITHVTLSLRRFDSPDLPSDFQEAQSSFMTSFPQQEPILVQPLNEELIAGYAAIDDVYGELALLLKVEMPRHIYQRGQSSLLYLVFLLLVGGLAATGTTSLMADKIVISRLGYLDTEVSDIGASGDLEARVSVTGNDELTSLANAINRTLEALERSHRKLLESEERYRTLFERTANPILVIDRKGQYIDCNEAALQFLECTREELLSKSVEDFAPPTQDEQSAEMHKSLWKSGGTIDTEYLINGRIKILELTITPAAWQGERVIFGVGKDVTQRKRAERALRQSEQRFRDIARTTGDWIWELDAQGRYTYVSPVVEQVLGYRPEEMLGKHYSDFIHPDDRAEFEELTQEAFHDKGAISRIASLYVHKQGHIITLETSGLQLSNGEGHLVGYRGVCRDITAERQMEERLATVYILGRELVLSRDIQQIAQSAIDAARLLFNCHLCGLWLVDEDEDTLVCQAFKSVDQLQLSLTELPLTGEKKNIPVTVVRSGKPIYISDVREEPRYVDLGIETRSELCVPLKVKDRVIGVLNTESEHVDAFDTYDQQLFLSLADQAALAIENAHLYDQMRATRDRMQSLSRRLVEIQEAERRHIARELHDEIGQIVTGLKLILEMGSILPVEEIKASQEEALTLVNELMAQVRNLSLDLRPTTLDDLGLVPALRWHFERYTAQTNVRVAFKHAGVEGQRFAPEVETAIYRITQEALTNVARHAGVDRVTARVWTDQETLNVQIEDEGTGFDVDTTLKEGNSSGLSGMIERATLLNGRMSIESSPDGGTRLTAEFPLASDSSSQR